MPKFFVTSNQLNEDKIEIVEDVNHIKNVLRKQINDKIEICDSQTGLNYLTEIIDIQKEKIICQILEQIESKAESNIKVTIFQGLPKADKMELIIQKSVELGVYEIVPTVMKRCVVKIDSKEEKKKIDRWQKISEVAAKQSGRDYIPKIGNITNIKNICENINDYDVLIMTYENEKEKNLKQVLKGLKTDGKNELKVGIIIGPEGGIDLEEVQKMEEAGAKIITLGDRILRTETVALSVLSIIMYELEM